MAAGENKRPSSERDPPKSAIQKEGAEGGRVILSPRFRWAAAMAGWDEEALLLATLVAEDSPARRPSQHKAKRLRSPASTTAARKRSPRKKCRVSPVALCLEDEEDGDEKIVREDAEVVVNKAAESEKGALAETALGKSVPSISRLREELSCAICLDICFEPSTTTCGHSYCIKCLQFATMKCGERCPKCRQLISNGRPCTISTVLWNTIQLLFPDEVETRRKNTAAASPSPAGIKNQRSNTSGRNGAARTISPHLAERERRYRRILRPAQSHGAAMALRLQREEILAELEGARERKLKNFRDVHANLRSIVSSGFYGPTRRRAA